MATINNRIFLAGDKRNIEQSVAGTNIKPGMLIETVASTTATGISPATAVTSINTVQPHSTVGGFAAGLFAVEDALQGRTVTDVYLKGGSTGGTTDNGTSIGDMVQVVTPYPGAIVMALCLGGSSYTVGLQLISDGAGRLKPITGIANVKSVIAEVVDALDLTPSGTADALVKVRIWQ